MQSIWNNQWTKQGGIALTIKAVPVLQWNALKGIQIADEWMKE